jgi:hypothetical protein
MQVTVNVTRAELEEMQTSAEQLKQGVLGALDRGLEDDGGTIYLAGFSVDVQVTD